MSEGGRSSWGRSVVIGTAFFVFCVLVLVLIPDRLTVYLSPRVPPLRRDLGVACAWLLGFLACCWVFVRIQPREGE
jgi:hypothetical protein